MKQQTITTGFGKYTLSNLLVKSNSILGSMTGNLSYPDPEPTLGQLTSAISDYSAALALPRSENRVLQVRVTRSELIQLLNTLALYVKTAAAGDLVVLDSSGYSLDKLPSTVGVLPKPQNVVVISRVATTTDVSWNKIQGASLYSVNYCQGVPTASTTWTIVETSKRRLRIQGLTSGALYTFRIAGLGTNPERVFSDNIAAYTI